MAASGYKDVKANGIFGNVTAASVKAFQESRRIPVTGSLDAATWPALMKVAGARIPERHRAAAARRSPYFRSCLDLWPLSSEEAEMQYAQPPQDPAPS
ncbi:MAG: peptidoglycan-binding domain-containing protein, partial [Solirubrobacterales bacterium]